MNIFSIPSINNVRKIWEQRKKTNNSPNQVANWEAVRFRCHETARVMATRASTVRTGRRAGRPASSRGSYGERSRGSTKDRTGTDELACLLCPHTTAGAEVDNTPRATSEAAAVGFAGTRRGSRRTWPVCRTPAWPWLLSHASLLLHNRRLSKPPPPP